VLGPLTEQQASAIERMRSSTEFLTMIIDEILTFSRLEAGREQVRPREATADAILRSTAAVLEPLARDKDLQLTFAAPEGPVPLFTDSEMVRRVLVNLGANAVKFTTCGSVTIDVTLRAGSGEGRGGGEVSFAVRDTGIGIAPEDLSRLFQPFSQLESGFTRRYGGTGLGLYISQRLAALLGGRIDVQSTPGKGSTFTLTIPARYEQ
jgi:signal transduction histidine kinase